ncbi:MAG: DUF11 domain-containing protein [Parcubacteria group bacterium]|nr:DUF11 domain-containing protein [Parcubacteria group bacterium]
MKKSLQLSVLAIIFVAGFSFVNTLPARALTIADYGNIPSACPAKSPNNYNNCGVFINNINVNGFNDNDTSESVRYLPIEGNYITPNKTITIQWNYYITSFNPPLDYFLVKYGCGDTTSLYNDDYIIANNIPLNKQTNAQSIQWSIPASVANYQYCKIWVYAKSNTRVDAYSTPTVGVSNTRAFTIPSPSQCVITNFSASNTNVNSGDSTTLNWNTSDCNYCSASASPSNSYWNGSQATYGSKTIYNLTNTTYFSLTCSGTNNSDTKNLTVTVQPPITRYTCNSNYQCVVASNGEYTSLTSCQNNCVAPVRYNCNTNTWTCSQATNGTYGTYSECTSACQPPITRYTCNSNYQCVVASNGEYTSLTSCQNNCVTPSQCVITNFISNDYSITNGDNIILTWNTTNCNYCTASTNPSNSYWTGSQATYGSRTIYNLQNPSTFTLTCSNNTTSDTETFNVSLQSVTPTLSFWADKYSLTQGESTYLRWTSNNTNYCVASNGWSGTKSITGYENTTPNTQTTYTLTCYGNSGQVSQTVTIYVAAPTTSMSFTKLGRNLSFGDRSYSKNIRVAQGDVIEFYLTITAGSANDLYNVVITDPLPSVFSYRAGTTKIDGVVQADTITTTGLSLGTINRGASKTITFQAISNNPGTYLTYTNTAQATASNITTVSDSATITYGLVAGAATVATGAEDSLIISLILSIGLAFLLWYYLKFNPQGRLALARLENKIREYRLEYLRHRMKR